MRFIIHYHGRYEDSINGRYEDSFIVEAETIDECREVALREVKARGWKRGD